MTTECIVISLIYLEQVMVKGKIEIRDFNWRTLVFTAILLASKFWEDIIWYNVDFVDTLELFSLRSINRLESEFLSLCDYNIYVSAEKYEYYQAMVRAISMQLEGERRTSGGANELTELPSSASNGNSISNQGLISRLIRATSFRDASLQPQESKQGTTVEYNIDSMTVPLLSHEQKNPLFKIKNSFTTSNNSEFTIR